MRNMSVQAALRPRVRDEEETATLEKDFFLNLLVMLLLLVGGQSLLAGARAPEKGLPSAPTQAVKIFIEEDGDLHLGSFRSPHVTVEEIAGKLGAVTSTEAGGSLPVLIHHTAKTPAGFVHGVLRAVGRVSNTDPLLALSQYTSLPCEKKEASP